MLVRREPEDVPEVAAAGGRARQGNLRKRLRATNATVIESEINEERDEIAPVHKLADAESSLGSRSRHCSRVAALLAASEANLAATRSSNARSSKTLQTFVEAQSAILDKFGASGLETEEATGIDDVESSWLLDPHLALDLNSFLKSFFGYAPPTASFTFDDSGILCLSILLDELIADMIQTWKATGAPLGRLQSIEDLRRAAIAQIVGARKDLKVDDAEALLTNRVRAMYAVGSGVILETDAEAVIGQVVSQHKAYFKTDWELLEAASQRKAARTKSVARSTEKLAGFGDWSWEDYKKLLEEGVNAFCAVYHKDEFYVGPIRQNQGAVIRIGAGDKGRVSLNKIKFKSPPFEKPEAKVMPSGRNISVQTVARARAKELYDHLTTIGWEEGESVDPPLRIPAEHIESVLFVG